MSENIVSITGQDIIQIGTKPILVGLADGDAGVLSFDNNIAEGKLGKNGNGIVVPNSTGRSATLTVRLLKGSSGDKYLNGEMNKYQLQTASYTLLNGQITHLVGDGKSNLNAVVYTLSGGFVQKVPNDTVSSEGNTEVAVTEWTLFFLRADRSVQ